MEDEVQIYEAAVKAFEDYCEEREFGYFLQVDSYPLTVSVYQSGKELHGQLSMEEETQTRRPVPSCSWTFHKGRIICQTKNDWVADEKTMNRLKNHAKKIAIAFLHQFFARAMLEGWEVKD